MSMEHRDDPIQWTESGKPKIEMDQIPLSLRLILIFSASVSTCVFWAFIVWLVTKP